MAVNIVSAWYNINQFFSVAKRSSIVVFTVYLMDFCGCNKAIPLHPCSPGIVCSIRSSPVFQVCTFVNAATASGQVIGFGRIVGQDIRIAHADRIKQDSLDFPWFCDTCTNPDPSWSRSCTGFSRLRHEGLR